jgi:hypothetical protein
MLSAYRFALRAAPRFPVAAAAAASVNLAARRMKVSAPTATGAPTSSGAAAGAEMGGVRVNRNVSADELEGESWDNLGGGFDDFWFFDEMLEGGFDRPDYIGSEELSYLEKEFAQKK